MHRIVLLMTLSGLMLWPSIAWTQFQFDIDQIAAVESPDEPEPAANHNHNQAVFGFQQNIDAWIFNRHQNATRARKYLEHQLDARVDTIKGVTDLTAAQLRRIQLAGSGDINRFFAKVEVIRDQFKGGCPKSC